MQTKNYFSSLSRVFSKPLLIFYLILWSGISAFAQCEWTVEISSNSFGDEINWELTNLQGEVILENDFNGNATGIFTAEAESPLNFYISTTGFFGDNDATYSVSNGVEVVASGSLEPNEEALEENLNCQSLEPCTEATAGEVEDLEVCNGIAFTLQTEGVSSGNSGLSYQWEKSTDNNTWEDIEGATNKIYMVSDGISETTYYRLTVSCEAGNTDTSDTITVSLKPELECYCIPVTLFGCSDDDRITNVTLEGESITLNNDSQCSPNAYGDYTALTAPDLSPGESYTLSITTDYYSPNYETATAWIDFNANGVFEEEERIGITGDSGMGDGTVNFDFVVPADLEAGTYRLRVRQVYGEDKVPSPCGQENYGEAEDYTVEVISLEACEGPVTAGNIEQDEMEVCAYSSFTIVSENVSAPADGLIRQWQSSPAGEDNWTDIEGAFSSSYTPSEGISEPTDFRLFVSCGDESDISNVVHVDLKPGSECYCTPQNTSFMILNYITNFQTEGGLTNIDHSSSIGTNGYADYTDSGNLQVFPGQEINTITTFEGGTSYVKIWIDWDEDGHFSEEEEVVNSNAYEETPFAASFVVPEDIEIGTTTRIKVRVNYLDDEFDACQNSPYGETEDYTIEVIGVPTCLPVSGMEAIDITENSIEISWNANEETQWEVIYGNSGFDPETQGESLIIEDTPTALITDLSVSTAYDFYVKAICDENNESILYGPKTYITACGVTDLPYTQGFDAATPPAITPCDFIDNTGNGPDWVTATYALVNGFSGKIIQYPYDNANAGTGWFITQGLNLEAGVNYQISYKYATNSSANAQKMKVAFGNSPTAAAMTNILADHDEILETSATPSTIIFDVPEDGVYHFGFGAYADENLSYIYLDDIEIDYGPTCAPVTEINVDNITDTSADVSWTPGINDTAWEVAYGISGFDPDEEGTIVEVDDNATLTLEDLDQNTTYDVYVKVICEEDEGEWEGPVSFKTLYTPPINDLLCDAISLTANDQCAEGPYTLVGADIEEGEPFGSCLNNFHGEQTVWFSFTGPIDGIALVTTDFENTDFSTEITVYEAPEDCADLTSLGEEVGCASSGEFEVELGGLTPGATYYIQVSGFNNATGNFCIEVQMDDTPVVCDEPSDIVITDIEDTYATVEWTANGNETEWEVAYGLAGFDMETEGQTEIVNTNTIVLTALDFETEYDVYVRAICNENLTSDWVGPESFTTKPLSVDSEIFDNFNFYPNPVKEVLTLKAAAQIEKVEVYNLLGQLILTTTPNTLETQLNTDQLQSGAYLMKVSIEGATKTFRVIKK